MPNLLAPPESLCGAPLANGKPCHAVKLRGKTRCVHHLPPGEVERKPDVPVDPSRSLDELMHLDPVDPANLQAIRLGLMQHVAAGTIEHQAASAIMRFAEAAHAHAPKRKGSDGFSSALRRVLETRPGTDDQGVPPGNASEKEGEGPQSAHRDLTPAEGGNGTKVD